MNHLYIIGNGFDLTHGLKTSYRDFILWHLNKLIVMAYEKQNEGIKHSDDLYDITRAPYMNILLGPAPKIDNPIQFDTVIEKLNHCTVNPSLLFKGIMDKDGWADIEKEYYSLMVNIISDDLKKKPGIDIKGLNRSFECLKNNFELYLKEEVLKKIETKKPTAGIQIIIDRTGFSRENRQLFLNFNYTNTFERLYHSNVDFECAEVINIHGEVNSTENPIIFGYGDEMDKNFKDLENRDENDFLDNMKSFGYFQIDNYKKLLKFIDAKEGDYKVHTIGHSLGLSDRLLLNTILERKNCKEIEIHYHKWADENKEPRNNYYQLAKNLSRHFNMELKGKMREIVVPYLDSKSMDY